MDVFKNISSFVTTRYLKRGAELGMLNPKEANNKTTCISIKQNNI